MANSLFKGKLTKLGDGYEKSRDVIPTNTLYNILKDFNLFFSEIGSVFQELDSDPDCRAIVLSGNGKMFCAGNPTTPFEHKQN